MQKNTSILSLIISNTKKRSGAFLFFALFVLVIIGMLISLQLSQEEQDIRQDASISSGIVKVSSFTSPSALVKGQSGSIILSANTNSLNVDGVQITFDVLTDIIPEITIENPNSDTLQLLVQSVTPKSGGFQVQVIATSITLGQSLSSSQPLPFAKLNFTPSGTGTIRLIFDRNKSLSTVFQSNPVQDQLDHISPLTFTVSEESPGIGGSNADTVGQCNSVCQNSNTCPTNHICYNNRCRLSSNLDSESCNPVVATATPIPIVNPTSSNLQGCGGSCNSNANCANNLICHQNVCRLATNPSSSNCTNTPDQGLQRTCNQYCADTSECMSGLTCYFNSCRHPQYPSSSTCSAPPAPTTKPITSNPGTGGTVVTTATPKPISLTPTPSLIVTNSASLDEYIPDQNLISNVFEDDNGNFDGEEYLEEEVYYENDELADEELYYEDDAYLDEESADFPSQLADIPPFVWYGIATFIIFLIILILYIVSLQLAKTNQKKLAQRLNEHQVKPEPSKSNSPVDMKGFAGNMQAHVEPLDEKE